MNWYIIISNIMVTFIVYLIYPFSHIYMYGKVSSKKATRIALLNVAVCSTIYFIIGTIATKYNYLVISVAPTIVYYFIARWMLADKNIVERENPNTRYSVDSIIGFVLSLVGIFISGLIYGTISLIFSIFALNETKYNIKLKGRSLAIAGLVISIIDIVAMLIYLLLLII